MPTPDPQSRTKLLSMQLLQAGQHQSRASKDQLETGQRLLLVLKRATRRISFPININQKTGSNDLP